MLKFGCILHVGYLVRRDSFVPERGCSDRAEPLTIQSTSREGSRSHQQQLIDIASRQEMTASRGHPPKNRGVSRQLEHDDVVTDRLITASHYPHRASSLLVLTSSLRQMLSYNLGSEGKVRLPTSEAGQATDFVAEFHPSSTKYSRLRKKRRYQIILSAVALSLLAVVVYVVDVQRSWAALEDNWTVSSRSQFRSAMLKLSDEYTQCRGCRYSQRYKAMGTQSQR